MIQWTESARRLLNEYCARSRTVVAAGGADPEEVSDDLRRHVEEEVKAARLSVVTEEDIRRILARIGEPTAVEAGSGSAEADAGDDLERRKRPGVILALLGVFLPALTLVFELIFGASAGALFDPFPTWLHVVAVALVPVANAWAWNAARAGDRRHLKWIGWMNAVALGTCIYYAALYIGFVPYACVGLIFFGAGLIPLAPYLALIATPMIRTRLAQGAGTRLPGAWAGALGTVCVLLLVQFSTAATYYGMAKFVSDDPETKAHGIGVLRTFGNREMMLRACYGSLRRELDVDVIRALFGSEKVTADQAREAYYRVTGKAFNSVPPPSLYTRTGRWTALDEEFSWDDGLGGEAVAQRVKGLSLQSSRMDAVAEPDASVVYCEWTLEFKNVSARAREARAQVALPPGAVVSRVTLWIDGEEREAAYGGRGQVRQAYQEVAVQQRRDPILVTTCGPDRVLMQCFPVLPNGGVMKVKLGITAPLLIDAPEKGNFVWPRFLERNFAIHSDLRHNLWIESTGRLLNGKADSAPPLSPDRPFALRDTLTEFELTRYAGATVVHRSGEVNEVWTPSLETGRIVRQTLRAADGRDIRRVVVVLDTSEPVKRFSKELAEAFKRLPESVEISLLMAADGLEKQSARPQLATAEVIRTVQARVSRASYRGGRDNVPALEDAWDLASAVENGVVLWIHGPQAVLLSPESGLRQRLEHNVMRTRLLELQVETGPDRLLEKLDGSRAIERIPRLGSVTADLSRVFQQWKGESQSFRLVRESIEGASTGVQVSRHIERLWARDEAARLAADRKSEAAVALASNNRLVTPLTGAVVLETKAQYERHGLAPVEPSTMPSVPEPGALSVLGVGILAWALMRRRQRRQVQRV